MSPQDTNTGPRVSKAEELLYGPYAPLVRKMGRAAEAVIEAGEQAQRLYSGSDAADRLSERQTDGSVQPTGHTRWAQTVEVRLGELVAQAVQLHRELAAECADRFAESRLVDEVSAPVEAVEPVG
jgi:hypothetical protein